MVSLKKHQSGFTIVELLIVIVVIGILATLVIITFTGVQQKARNNKRQTDIEAVASHLAAVYVNSGAYPSFTALTNAGWRSTNMQGLDPSALTDPNGATISNTAVAAGTMQYSYVGSGCTGVTVADTCTGFVLTAHQEGTATDYSKASN